MLQFQADFAYWLPLGDVHRHKRNLDPGGTAGVFESVRDVLHCGVELFQLCRKLFSFVGAGVADRLRVEQTADFAAVLHHVQGFEQVGSPGGKRRVHHDCRILLAGAEREKIIMHHAEIVFLELRPEITGKLDAVKINLFQPVQILPADLSRFGIVVNAARGVNLAGKCPITGGRFQHGAGEAAEAVDFGF